MSPLNPEQTAVRLARRSRLQRFGTGAVVLDADGRVCATGWSHLSAQPLARYRSVHAELHALSRLHVPAEGGVCVVATWSVRGERIKIARPCQECARLLVAAGLSRVRYSTESGGWEEIDLTAPLPELCDYSPRTPVPA